MDYISYFLRPTKVGTSHYATSLWHFYYCEELILPQAALAHHHLLGETWRNKEKLGETKMSLWQNLVFFLVTFGLENGLVGFKSNF